MRTRVTCFIHCCTLHLLIIPTCRFILTRVCRRSLQSNLTSKMEIGVNFVDHYEIDVAICVMALLDDPADLARVAAVSHSWRQFVISNCLFKELILRKVPVMSHIAHVVEVNHNTNKLVEGSNSDTLLREHHLYTSFLRAIINSMNNSKECRAYAVGASSTNLYPERSIMNTLVPSSHPRSYWSSEGQSDPYMQEHLLFKLIPSISVVTEICIRPYRVSWGQVYSAIYVRFCMGHAISNIDMEVDVRDCPSQKPTIDKYVWTYTSPVFPMIQESFLQVFKLPQPAVNIGGFLLIELFGGAQEDQLDELFYIRVGHVRFMATALQPEFDVEMDDSGELVLKYCPDAHRKCLYGEMVPESASYDEHPEWAMLPVSLATELLEDED